MLCFVTGQTELNPQPANSSLSSKPGASSNAFIEAEGTTCHADNCGSTSSAATGASQAAVGAIPVSTADCAVAASDCPAMHVQFVEPTAGETTAVQSFAPMPSTAALPPFTSLPSQAQVAHQQSPLHGLPQQLPVLSDNRSSTASLNVPTAVQPLSLAEQPQVSQSAQQLPVPTHSVGAAFNSDGLAAVQHPVAVVHSGLPLALQQKPKMALLSPSSADTDAKLKQKATTREVQQPAVAHVAVHCGGKSSFSQRADQECSEVEPGAAEPSPW